MTMFKIRHETFDFVTTDQALVIERLKQGFKAVVVKYITQPFEEGQRINKIIDYGDIQLLSY